MLLVAGFSACAAIIFLYVDGQHMLRRRGLAK